MRRWDVDFSSALHNRTGKFFIGRDIIEDQADLIDNVYYWRIAAKAPPVGLPAKLLGRAVQWDLRRGHAETPRFAFRPRNRLLHLDPFTVLYSDLRPDDAVLCHDLGPITHPDLFTASTEPLYRAVYARIAKIRPRVIFISQATKDAFADHYGPAHDGRIVYNTIRVDLKDGPQTPVAGLDGAFLLTVGSIGRRKNQRATIAAFAASGLAERGVQFVLCGTKEPGGDDVVALAERTPGVRILPYVSDGELAWLYAHARGFVLMSLLEGFGVPVAEAAAYGVVPLVTEASVLGEVAGESALTAGASDTAGIAAGMIALIDMPDAERDARRAALLTAIRRFSREQFRHDWRVMLRDDLSPETTS